MPKPRSAQQSKDFIEAARSLGCDDDEDAFDAKLKAVASAPPPKPEKKSKTKKPAK
jgi:hypothetical protein